MVAAAVVAGRSWLRSCCVSCCSSSTWWSMSLLCRLTWVCPVLGQSGDMPVVATTVHEGVAGAVPAVVDVPVKAATWSRAQ